MGADYLHFNRHGTQLSVAPYHFKSNGTLHGQNRFTQTSFKLSTSEIFYSSYIYVIGTKVS